MYNDILNNLKYLQTTIAICVSNDLFSLDIYHDIHIDTEEIIDEMGKISNNELTLKLCYRLTYEEFI